jgi:peroxiredoxin family protein
MTESQTGRSRLAIVASKGSLDWAYPPLMMAVQAARKGWDVGIFFTFYGLNIIHKEKGKDLKIAPVGNPAMPMPVPTLMGALPGMTALATHAMAKRIRAQEVPTVPELLEEAIGRGVKLWPCGFTVDVFGYEPEDFIEGCEERSGSPAFLEYAKDADVTIFV